MTLRRTGATKLGLMGEPPDIMMTLGTMAGLSNDPIVKLSAVTT